MNSILFGMPTVGERVFNTDSLTGKIYSLKIKEIYADLSFGGIVLVFKAKGWRRNIFFNMEDLGKTVFLSKTQLREVCHG